jgi:hypothetical protein
VLTKNGLHTFADVVIIDPTCVDLLLRSCTTQGFATSDIVQVKERVQAKEMSYCDQHPTYQFLPLAIEVFGASPKIS